MRDQVLLPLIDSLDDTLLTTEDPTSSSTDPLSAIESFLQNTIQKLNEHQATRETYEIMMSKCEYVDDFEDVLQQILNNCSHIIVKLEQAYLNAQHQGLISDLHSANQLAMDTHLFFSGLLHMWVKDTHGTRFRNQAATLISTHINLRKQ